MQRRNGELYSYRYIHPWQDGTRIKQKSRNKDKPETEYYKKVVHDIERREKELEILKNGGKVKEDFFLVEEILDYVKNRVPTVFRLARDLNIDREILMKVLRFMSYKKFIHVRTKTKNTFVSLRCIDA